MRNEQVGGVAYGRNEPAQDTESVTQVFGHPGSIGVEDLRAAGEQNCPVGLGGGHGEGISEGHRVAGFDTGSLHYACGGSFIGNHGREKRRQDPPSYRFSFSTHRDVIHFSEVDPIHHRMLQQGLLHPDRTRSLVPEKTQNGP